MEAFTHKKIRDDNTLHCYIRIQLEEWRKGDSYINIWLSHHPIKKALMKLFTNSGGDEKVGLNLYFYVFILFYFILFYFSIFFGDVVVQLVVGWVGIFQKMGKAKVKVNSQHMYMFNLDHDFYLYCRGCVIASMTLGENPTLV